MKYLIAILGVFLLMGCQTTNKVTPTIESSHLLESAQPSQEDNPFLNTMKPIVCGSANKILNRIMKEFEEEPIIIWKDDTYGHRIMIFMNEETGSVTALEWANEKTVCFLSTGVQAQLNKKINRSSSKGY